jgi:hypothetical protein
VLYPTTYNAGVVAVNSKVAGLAPEVIGLAHGVDVMITIFCDFCQFSAKKMAFFSKSNVMIKNLHDLALFRRIFLCENIFKIITSVGLFFVPRNFYWCKKSLALFNRARPTVGRLQQVCKKSILCSKRRKSSKLVILSEK